MVTQEGMFKKVGKVMERGGGGGLGALPSAMACSYNCFMNVQVIGPPTNGVEGRHFSNLYEYLYGTQKHVFVCEQ